KAAREALTGGDKAPCWPVQAFVRGQGGVGHRPDRVTSRSRGQRGGAFGRLQDGESTPASCEDLRKHPKQPRSFLHSIQQPAHSLNKIAPSPFRSVTCVTVAPSVPSARSGR